MDTPLLEQCDDLVTTIAERRGSCDREAVYARSRELADVAGGSTDPKLRDAADALVHAAGDEGWIDWDTIDNRFGELVLALRTLQASP